MEWWLKVEKKFLHVLSLHTTLCGKSSFKQCYTLRPPQFLKQVSFSAGNFFPLVVTHQYLQGKVTLNATSSWKNRRKRNTFCLHRASLFCHCDSRQWHYTRERLSQSHTPASAAETKQNKNSKKENIWFFPLKIMQKYFFCEIYIKL